MARAKKQEQTEVIELEKVKGTRKKTPKKSESTYVAKSSTTTKRRRTPRPKVDSEESLSIGKVYRKRLRGYILKQDIPSMLYATLFLAFFIYVLL